MVYKKVFSASRMTDMPQWHPQLLIDAYNSRLAKGEQCHTLMLWTKFPGALLNEPLYSFLTHIRDVQGVQLATQLTITGMGGTWAEPRVPKWRDSVALLPQVAKLLGSPERIKLRIDPLLRCKDAAGNVFSNYDTFEPILAAAADVGVKHFATSFVENNAHSKVARHLQSLGYTLEAPDDNERLQMIDNINTLASKYGVTISACAVPGLPQSACIDADWLEKLHPTHEPLDHRQKKSRPLCGCCMDTDLGGWPPKKCYSGCVYCYANPIYFKV